MTGGSAGPCRRPYPAAGGQRGAEKELRIIQGATHLFEEPGTLEEAARLAANWFAKYLSAPAQRVAAAAGRERIVEGRTP